MKSCNGKPDSSGRNCECRPGSLAAGEQPVGEERFVHRFNRQACGLLIVQTFETATGNRYTRRVFEAYRGL